jgi:NodT family efflux transporter outer membrane factor (OMF) lipoprotein
MKHAIFALPLHTVPRTLAWCLALGGLLTLTACESTGPKADTSTYAPPPVYRNALAASEAPTGAAPPAEWWIQYGSPELDRLVDRALANNGDLRVATLQVAQAQIRAEQSRSGKLPSLSAPLRIANQAQGSTTDSAQYSQLALTSAYRVDVWGEQRGLIDSADMQLERAIHERENTQRTVIGNLVSSYIAYLSLSDSIQIAKENEAVAADVLRSVERRLVLGDATLDDVEQQRAVLAAQQVLLPSLENQQEEQRNGLSRLVGGLPGNLVLSEQGLDSLQLPAVRAGLPSALLLARPDIRMMEARMRAADANIDVARARLLPPLDLSAQAGYASASLASLFQPQNLLVTTAAALAVTIFDGGQRRGEKAFAQSYYEEMVETYGKTVLQAVRDVESALAGLRAAQRRVEAQKAVTRSALNIFKLSNEAFAAGAVDQVTLLEHRKNYQRSADESQRMKSELLRGYATLAYALGLGSVLNDGASPHANDETARTALERDVTVRGVRGVPVLAAATDKSAAGPWDVELPGVFHRSALVPLWRDLQARVAAADSGIWIRGLHAGHVESKTETAEAWYRVQVSGFKDRNAGLSYCDSLQRAGQSCKVVGEAGGVPTTRVALRQ